MIGSSRIAIAKASVVMSLNLRDFVAGLDAAPAGRVGLDELGERGDAGSFGAEAAV